jgi:hypothetical protein
MCRICWCVIGYNVTYIFLCLVVIGLPDCTTYFLLHVSNFISYIPLGSLLSVFSASSWYIVFVVLNAMRTSVLLNKFVKFFITGLLYENVTHFSVFVFMGFICFSSFVLILSYFFFHVYNLQGVWKRALQLWKLIEFYTEDIHKVLKCQNVAKHTEFYLG